jgi:hypothetical protein
VEADAELHDLREALGASEDRARRLESKLSSASAAGDAAAAKLRAGWEAAEGAHRDAQAALRQEVGGGARRGGALMFVLVVLVRRCAVRAVAVDMHLEPEQGLGPEGS